MLFKANDKWRLEWLHAQIGEERMQLTIILSGLENSGNTIHRLLLGVRQSIMKADGLLLLEGVSRIRWEEKADTSVARERRALEKRPPELLD